MQQAESETIAAVASPPGEGAIALLRISGSTVDDLLAKAFRSTKSPLDYPRRQVLGSIIRSDGTLVDEVVACYYPRPASYTGEDMAEICCHGGAVITRMVLDTLLAAGATPARPGEFTERAFINGKLDMTQAEAVMDLISAQTELAAHAASEQLQGILGRDIVSLRDDLLATLAELEAGIDFPDEDIAPQSLDSMVGTLETTCIKLTALLDTAQRGRILREGARLVIYGAPNVGKSSLLNRLLGYKRAIVSEQPGTTRDAIEEVINLGGYPVRLVDTAGVRKSGDSIELEGMQFTRERLSTADLVLYIVDASQPLTASQPEPETAAMVLTVLNKCDLGIHPYWQNHSEVQISCLDGTGMEQLEKLIIDSMLGHTARGSSSAIAINARHRHCLSRALDHCQSVLAGIKDNKEAELVAIDLREALAALGAIVGDIDNEDLLGEIFSRFCIGK